MKPDKTRNARQSALKSRTLSAGGKRLSVYIGAEAKAALDALRATGISERAAVESALIHAAICGDFVGHPASKPHQS